MKKFYAVVGNPPYQEENSDNNRQAPLYPSFMDGAYAVAEKVELITPARFLFDAGQTPKAWNEKMLNDEHLSVLDYTADGSSVFSNTDIKGGIAITYRDEMTVKGPIGTFTPYPALNTVAKKVECRVASFGGAYMNSIVSPRGNYRFTPQFGTDFPQIFERLGKGTGNMFGSNLFSSVPECSEEEEISESYRFLCRINGKRVFRFVLKKYVMPNAFIDNYNVAIPQANGRGEFGEPLSESEILRPGDCTSDTFLSLGQLSTVDEANSLAKYIRCKFARALLGIKKVTQNTPPSTWSHVPLQDFAATSDIDWSQAVADIDQQLYHKYGLDADEIEFIESHVKEMS